MPCLFCNFVVDKGVSLVNVVISSVDVNFSIVSGKTVVDLIVLSEDVFGIYIYLYIFPQWMTLLFLLMLLFPQLVLMMMMMMISSADDDRLIVSDGVDGENVLCDISVASGVVSNSADVFGDIGVDSSVFINSTVVSGKVFVVCNVHSEETSFVFVKVTISE